MQRIWLTALLALWLIGCTMETSPPPTAAIIAQVPATEIIVTDLPPTASPATEIPPTSTTQPTTTPSSKATTPPTATPSPEKTTPALPGQALFTFTAGEPNWYTVDDDVMGGVSSSTVVVIEPDVLFFSGTMSLENNGGFSSVRSDWTPTNLSEADGLLLRVLGDGKMYRLRIRASSTGRDISYNATFATTPETWKLVYIPFADMIPTYRGFVMDVGALDTANIGSFGFHAE